MLNNICYNKSVNITINPVYRITYVAILYFFLLNNIIEINDVKLLAIELIKIYFKQIYPNESFRQNQK